MEPTPTSEPPRLSRGLARFWPTQGMPAPSPREPGDADAGPLHPDPTAAADAPAGVEPPRPATADVAGPHQPTPHPAAAAQHTAPDRRRPGHDAADGPPTVPTAADRPVHGPAPADRPAQAGPPVDSPEGTAPLTVRAGDAAQDDPRPSGTAVVGAAVVGPALRGDTKLMALDPRRTPPNGASGRARPVPPPADRASTDPAFYSRADGGWAPGGPLGLAPVSPGLVGPQPVSPGLVAPAPADPGPVDPGPGDPGPGDPAPADPGPVDSGPGNGAAGLGSMAAGPVDAGPSGRWPRSSPATGRGPVPPDRGPGDLPGGSGYAALSLHRDYAGAAPARASRSDDPPGPEAAGRGPLGGGGTVGADPGRAEIGPPQTQAGRRLRPGEVPQGRITLWDEDATEQIRHEWHEVKAQFVDDPVSALNRAHGLLTEAVHRLTESLLAERDGLDPLRDNDHPDTERMRMAMRNYREFLDRILAL